MFAAMRSEIIGCLLGVLAVLTSCRQVALVEQLANIPNASWPSERTDTFRFEIQDTSLAYNLAVVVRHTNQYAYRNLWVRLQIKQPALASFSSQDFNLPIASAENWLGKGMGDIYEVRPKLFKQAVRFTQKGEVSIVLQHIMRQDPLPGIMQIGVRVEPQ